MTIDIELLKDLVSEFQDEPQIDKFQKQQHTTFENNNTSTFDLESWIIKYLPDAKGPTPCAEGGQKWILPDCSFRPGDIDSMFIIQFANGAISAGCQHDTCPGSRTTGNHWLELRGHFEGSTFGSRHFINSKFDKELSTLPHTEYGLSERFIRRFGDRCRFIESWGGKWLIYNGQRWELSDCAAQLYAQETINALPREVWYLKEEDDVENQKEEKNEDPAISSPICN